MCMATAVTKAIAKHDPLVKKIEQETGYRPYGVGGLADDLGIKDREKNRFYQKGGRGFVKPVAAQRQTGYHVGNIAAARGED